LLLSAFLPLLISVAIETACPWAHGSPTHAWKGSPRAWGTKAPLQRAPVQPQPFSTCSALGQQIDP